MKTKTLCFVAILVAGSVLLPAARAATGFFGNTFFVGDGGTFYDVGSTATGNPDFSAGLGDLTQGDSFTVGGFELNTFEDNGSEITHMNMFWTVDAFSNVHSVQIFPAPGKVGNNRFWQITSGTQNLLDNNGVGELAAGNYTLQIYFEGYTNGNDTPGNIFLNNGGANYSASFTVVPEPSISLLGALGVLGLLRRRR